MARPRKKDARYMNFYLTSSIADKIDEYSEETGIPKTKIVEDALLKYMQEIEEQKLILEEYAQKRKA